MIRCPEGSDEQPSGNPDTVPVQTNRPMGMPQGNSTGGFHGALLGLMALLATAVAA